LFEADIVDSSGQVPLSYLPARFSVKRSACFSQQRSLYHTIYFVAFQVLGRLEGSWIDGIVADGRVLWSHLMLPCCITSVPPHQLLPSDCSLRPDVAVRSAFPRKLAPTKSKYNSRVSQALKCGNLAEANRMKDVLESEKRADKALRQRCSA
jgi:hypothetical protein